MTAVVGINVLSELIFIADTRVSFIGNVLQPKDSLRKIYIFPVGNPQKSILLGFAGELKVAKKVIVFLKEKKFKNFQRRVAIESLKDDIKKWIEEAAADLPPQKRTSVQFLLGCVEPNRNSPIVNAGEGTGQWPYPGVYQYTYSIDRSGSVRCTKMGLCTVIGSGKALEARVRARIYRAIDFTANQPDLHSARAVLIGEIVSLIYAEDGKASETVGGPCQIVRLSPKGVFVDYIWPHDVPSRDSYFIDEGEITKIYHRESEKEYVLKPIWELV